MKRATGNRVLTAIEKSIDAGVSYVSTVYRIAKVGVFVLLSQSFLVGTFFRMHLARAMGDMLPQLLS